MKKGKWYLVHGYDIFTLEDEDIPLKATTEKEAIAEAKAKWYEKQANPFTDGPTNLFLICREGGIIRLRVRLRMD